MGFPDAEDVLAELLEPIAPVYTATPAFSVDNPTEYVQEVPFIVVQKFDGASNAQAWEDISVVEVACFGSTRAASKEINNAVRAKLAGAAAVQTAAGFIDQITESTSPNQIPYGQEDVRRVISNWAITARQQFP